MLHVPWFLMPAGLRRIYDVRHLHFITNWQACFYDFNVWSEKNAGKLARCR